MKNNKITTIKLEKETKERLDKLKENFRETYDDVLKKILFILNIIKTNPEKARTMINKIDLNRKQYTEVYQSSQKENRVK